LQLYVIRHAQAVSSADWQGEDKQRPLSERGKRQAERLVQSYEGTPIDVLLSSPYRRSVQTLNPLASARKLPVTTGDEFGVGAGANTLLGAVMQLMVDAAVVCTHADVLEDLLRRLVGLGLVAAGRTTSENAGTWKLSLSHDGISQAAYLPPP
jgi:broad specificity phosphatase PhoE